MIFYLLMLTLPVIACCQHISQKQFNLKFESPNVLLFSALTSIIALCFFLITSRFDLEFNAALTPYALLFAIGYSSAWVGTVLAVRYGLLALSSLIVSCSLIFPTLYGVLMGETVTPLIVIGLILIFAALVMVNLKSEKGGKFSLKWFACVMVAFIGNGACSISQNMQKRALGDSYTHEFMIIALGVSSVLLLVCAMLRSRNIIGDLKGSLPYAVANGSFNALQNFLVLTIIGNIPNTVFYPTNAALGMIATFLLAFIFYKERFSKLQYVGYALGVLSIVLLNI